MVAQFLSDGRTNYIKFWKDIESVFSDFVLDVRK